MTTCPTCQEIQEERAAIHEFDGGCSRKEAEELAWKERCRKHRPKIYQPPHGVTGDPSTGVSLSSARMKQGVGKISVDGFQSFDSV
jgi:hypothetical protein